MSHPTRLLAAESSLVVVDVQEKLIPKIPNGARVVENIRFLLEVAELLDVQRIVTEQYPKGLGPTVAPLAEKFPEPRPEKLGFSCCTIESFVPELFRTQKKRVILTGIESHVCILNTALDLLAENFWVYLPVDAVGSRGPIDHEMAVRRLEGAGVIATTTETIAFEWLGGSSHPKFKDVSSLIQAAHAHAWTDGRDENLSRMAATFGSSGRAFFLTPEGVAAISRRLSAATPPERTRRSGSRGSQKRKPYGCCEPASVGRSLHLQNRGVAPLSSTVPNADTFGL